MVSLNGNYIIGENTQISDFVTIMGPVIIGKNVKIMPGVFIRPYTIIGDDCEIGHGSEIKHAIIMDNGKVISKLPLPIAGLMSDKEFDFVLNNFLVVCDIHLMLHENLK